ncbi:MAG: Ca2+-binding RTX toxin-like protein [Kiritimatiellia bacterium]|jgi:Ca2+-binding RTX toxin-like protein
MIHRLALVTTPLTLLAMVALCSCAPATTTDTNCDDTGVDPDAIDWELDNVWEGTTGNDELYSGAGADTLNGAAGDDNLLGGRGPDTINGGVGNDRIYGGVGPDNLLGDNGDDRLYGGQGKDTINGGEGDDHISGGSEADNLRGAADDDVVNGDSGNDEIFGGPGNDNLTGGLDSDKLFGGDDDDSLFGGMGDDELDGGLGLDLLYGGEGNDIFVLSLECGVRDVIFDFDVTEDQLLLPEIILFGQVKLEATRDSTGVVIRTTKPQPDCEIALVTGASVSQVEDGLQYQ